jgi:hypothetical protein
MSSSSGENTSMFVVGNCIESYEVLESRYADVTLYDTWARRRKRKRKRRRKEKNNNKFLLQI